MFNIQIKKKFDNFKIDFSFSSENSETIALFGPSGAGKTTIISCCAGFLNPDEGHIEIGNKIYFDKAKNINLIPQTRNIGLVQQRDYLFPNMTIMENLVFGLKRTKNAHYIKLDEIIELLDISHLLERRTFNISGGERQRIAIGRALLSQPKSLLLDEPFSALDETRKSKIMNFILDLKAKYSLPIIYVTHNKEEAKKLADTIVYFSDGMIERVEKIIP